MGAELSNSTVAKLLPMAPDENPPGSGIKAESGVPNESSPFPMQAGDDGPSPMSNNVLSGDGGKDISEYFKKALRDFLPSDERLNSMSRDELCAVIQSMKRP